MTNTLYEKPPKHPSVNDFLAPEHYRDGQHMRRDRRGNLIIELHPIFIYSQLNPPDWIVGAIRKQQ